MNEFSKNVIQLIKKIPRGKVATYGQIAILAKNPRGARAVSWLLHSSTDLHKLPWQRVINGKGKIAFPEGTPSYLKQTECLRKEGVVVSAQGNIDLAKFGWQRKFSK